MLISPLGVIYILTFWTRLKLAVPTELQKIGCCYCKSKLNHTKAPREFVYYLCCLNILLYYNWKSVIANPKTLYMCNRTKIVVNYCSIFLRFFILDCNGIPSTFEIPFIQLFEFVSAHWNHTSSPEIFGCQFPLLKLRNSWNPQISPVFFNVFLECVDGILMVRSP